MSTPTEWYRDQYLVSTSPSLLQPAAVSEAFKSDSMYWAKPIGEALVKKMLEKSLCFGLYELPSSTLSIAGPQAPAQSVDLPLLIVFLGKSGPRQIGLARIITDEVTFAYLTDVYVLEEFQKKGLGTWLIECVEVHVMKWPDLRQIMLIASHKNKFYEDKLGVKPFPQGVDNGPSIFTRKGLGSVFLD
ncbi:hypothetical protein LCER1_G003771 [Lachnellula cervina]|uniref:N-acetyltransferase domain-containing protein n=1 Tax=Lachnellula cervina TaxID=1316786 RepID=A0A7D8YSF9_9HELO|nr:hypothetical protein LCER1_G003771 [Lachnellula cervina]